MPFGDTMGSITFDHSQFVPMTPSAGPFPWSEEDWQAFVARTVAEGPPSWWAEAVENGEIEEAF